ncbi:hypothetical protein ACFU5O_01390 [Streptomyces sp. NPDC057445]|uniref:hypothetical protein n=1 Tax=Streptomyces sp. NPDC057445 TaxID=3346136 RepID=UPI00367DD4B3
MKKRLAAAAGGVLAAAALTVGAWPIWFRPPYVLADTPPVDVTVSAGRSRYQDVAETAEDVDTLVRVYVQRLRARDAEGLARLAGPAYPQPRGDAKRFVDAYAAGAQGHVDVTVAEGPVPYFNQVTLAYERTGRRQDLLLVHDDGDWWIALGEGDPAAGR